MIDSLLIQKVMLLEDDHTMLELLRTLLELEGYQVLNSEDCDQETFLGSMKNEKPDFLVLDVHLRQANGLDIVKTLRQDDAFQDLKIIMTSGMNIGESCINSGADAFIMKPFMPEELIGLLK